MSQDLFNPLDKTNLGKSVIDALMATKAVKLGDLPKFKGAGVYAIYYSGQFAPYAALSALNRKDPKHPIYIGKAIPQGGRKGLTTDASLDSHALSARLHKHAESIAATSDLKVTEFGCRYLAVDDIWIGLGETLLIQRFSPLWNQVVEGFGNNDPGKGRHKGMRPLWDELHPGRAWARRLKPAKQSREQILAMVGDYMAKLGGG
ncbi:MAG: Eco29kI family restriction endonuclease [Opitutae bacterium]|nr:Eco29kI family restriction endonuclease [Opitutae bacterium]